MPATNQSSTKSRPLWAAKLCRSKIHDLLIVAIGLATTISLFILDVPLLWQLLYAMISLLILARVVQKNAQSRRHLIHNSDGSWSLSHESLACETTSTISTRKIKPPCIEHKFQLCQSGYRSANLIVLVFASSDSDNQEHANRSPRLIRIPVWFDQIESSGFSYLHLQLAYAATPLPSLKDRLRAALRYTQNHSFNLGRGNETTHLPRR